MELFSLDAKIRLDLSELEAGLREAKSELSDLEDEISASIGLDTGDFDSQIADLKGELEGVDGLNASASASLDTDNADAGLASIEGDLTDYGDANYTADAGLDTTDAVDNYNGITDDLNDYDGSSYTAEVNVDDNASGALSDISGAAEDAEGAVGDDGLNGILSGFGKAFTVTAVVAGLGAVTDAAWEAAMATAQVGDTIDKQSQMMGMSAKAYQQWQFVLSRNGADISVLKTISRTITAQAGTEGFADALSSIGLNFDDFTQMSSENQVYEIVRGLTAQKGQLSDLEFNQLAEQLLGSRGFMQLMPLFNAGLDGEGGFDALWQFAGENTMSDEAVKNAAGVTDALTNLSTAWGTLRDTVIGTEILPTITAVVDQITGVVTTIRQANEDNISLWGFLTGVDDGGVARVAEVGQQYATDMATASASADRANTLVSVLQALEQQMGPLARDTDTWKNAMAELKALYPDITGIIEANNGSFSDGVEQIREYIQAQKDLAIQQAKQKALQGYQDTYTTELAKQYEYQAQALGAKTELESIARALGYTGDNGAFAFSGTQEAYTGEYENFDPGTFYEWAGKLNELSLMGSVGLSADQKSQLNLINLGNLLTTYTSSMASAREQEAAVTTALTELENMGALVEQQMTESMGGVESSTETAATNVSELGSAATSAAEELSNISIPAVLGGSANGLWRVPYDNYATRLHEGEAVLTRVEAERWRDGKGSGAGSGRIDATANLNISNYNVYGSADEQTLVSALVSEQRRQLRAAGERV